MRIVFFTHYFPPEGNAPASRTYDHCVRWIAQGAEVTVITCVPNVPNGIVYDGYKNKFWPQVEMVDGIRVIRVKTYIAANSRALFRILNYASYLVSAVFAYLLKCKRPDLVIATSPQFFCGWAGTIASILKWTPFVLEVRDIWPESIIAVGAMRKGISSRFLEVLEKMMYQSATHIVAVGKGYKDAILKRVPNAQNISIVTNGVDIKKFNPRAPDQSFLEQWNLQDKFVCAYVGTIGMAHGLNVVIEAANILKQQGRTDIKFCLVGAGANLRDLQTQVTSLELDDFIVFTGRLAKDEMGTVLASSSALLIHLRKCELFTTVIPSKMFEAMAMCRPIIMGVDGEAREIVRSSGAGIDLEPGDSKGLVESVCKLADDPELAERLGKSGRPFVSTNYTRDRLARDYFEILEAVADHRPVSHPTESTA